MNWRKGQCLRAKNRCGAVLRTGNISGCPLRLFVVSASFLAQDFAMVLGALPHSRRRKPMQ